MQGRQLGDLIITRVVELVSEFDALTFFPDTTPADWAPHEAWLKPAAMDPASGALRFPMQSYVVRTSHHTILIDSCIGNHKERVNRPQWHRKDDAAFMTGLAGHGLAPEAIDYVLCTHLHADHIGWNTQLVDGRWIPTFPNARYLFSRQEVAAWEASDDVHRRQAQADSVLPVIAAGQAVLVDHDHALDDEVWLAPTPGHSPDHLAVCLASQGRQAVMSGDLMHSPIQCLHPEWRVQPDWDPELAKRTRRAFLERHADTGILICTAHFPLPSAGLVSAAGDAFRFTAETPAW